MRPRYVLLWAKTRNQPLIPVVWAHTIHRLENVAHAFGWTGWFWIAEASSWDMGAGVATCPVQVLRGPFRAVSGRPRRW